MHTDTDTDSHRHVHHTNMLITTMTSMLEVRGEFILKSLQLKFVKIANMRDIFAHKDFTNTLTSPTLKPLVSYPLPSQVSHSPGPPSLCETFTSSRFNF